MTVDRTALIGRPLRAATYTISEVDVNDFLGVVTEPDFMASDAVIESLTSVDSGASTASLRSVPPSFAPFVAVLGLLRTFDWQADFLFDYRTGTAMFGEQSIEFHRPLLVGQSVAISATISDVYEKQGKQTFDVVEVTFDIKSSDGEDLLMTGQQSYILFK